MLQFEMNRLNRSLLMIAVCIAGSIAGFVTGNTRRFSAGASRPLVQHSDQKTIERYERPGEPFEFDNLSVRKAKIALSQRFSAKSFAERSGGNEGDWLEDLEFTLRNTSSRQITFILLQLQFPETEVDGPLMAFNQRIGVHPKASVEPAKNYKPLNLQPGDTVTFSLSARELNLLKEFISYRKFDLADLNKLVVRIVTVAFSDGTKWEQDYYYRPNPTAPGGYERVNQYTLPQLHVAAISLDYMVSSRSDRYGNEFRYRSRVYDEHGAHLGRWACDVFFVVQ